MTGKQQFFIVGAPKCGTTSLASWLAEHPEIFFSPIKEPHYYNDDMQKRTVRNRRAYTRLFRDVKEQHKAVGEGSTWYLYSRNAINNIEKDFPAAKYIVLVRNPVDMAVSLYWHNRRRMNEDQESFEQAWALQEDRRAGRRIPKGCMDPAYLQYHDACALGSLVEKLVKTVGHDRVLMLRLENMQQDPMSVYHKVLSFIGVKDDSRQLFPVENESSEYRSAWIQVLMRIGYKLKLLLGIKKSLGVASLNEKKREKEAIPPELRKKLTDIFSGEIKKIDKLFAASSPAK